ncbi:MAG: arylsulfatase A [Mariniblastus sp.]|jgi:arylsulfatase A
MKNIVQVVLCWFAVTCLPNSLVAQTKTTSTPATPPPNVLLIYADDQGTYDLNCYGSNDLHTPNLDGLAKRGIRFTQMYSPSAICSASRAGLLTGRFPVRAGVPGNVSSTQGIAGMPPAEITLAEHLKSAGYTTGHVGKWHLGYTEPTMPRGQGFDTSFGHMGGCIDNYSHFFYWKGPNRHDLWRNEKMIWEDGKFFPDLMVRECNQFLESNRDKPFFLYWALNIPHYPMQGESKWHERYQTLESPRRQYAELISTMDEKIGSVLTKLEELKLSDNTIVIFQSDHGHSTEERAFYGGGNAGKLRGAKACLFEGGIRVPSIVSWPNQLEQNTTRNQIACGIDWFPTLSELCNANAPTASIDGKSLVDVLTKPAAPSPHKSLYWHLGNGSRAQWAVREGKWKLLGNATDTTDRRISPTIDPLFLVNLESDESETTNVASQHADVVTRLQATRKQALNSLKLPN